MSTTEKNDRSEDRAKKYHQPKLEDYGNARDLTKSNPGAGPDGAIFDNVDSGADGAGTAS
jgi:hypothetical protein